MTDSRQSSEPRQDRLNELIAEYLRRVDRGEQVDPDQFVAPFPDLADSFAQYLRDAALADGLKPSLGAPPELPPVTRDTAGSPGADETIPPSYVREGRKETPEARQFGRYRLVELIGQGAMGSVYLAEDPDLRRHVALKIPKFRDDQDTAARERFQREARAAATISHPNICQVHDIGEQDGTPFITMAYVQGKSLSQFTSANRQWPERDVAKLARKIAVALAEAHAKGVVHRDLKPANIMLDQRHEPIVMDFGLAGGIGQPDEATLTHTGMLLGTPAYMSPEQAEGDFSRVGPASDVYSLGVICYELLTGRLPFEGPAAAMIVQIARDEPRRPSELRPSLDKRLEAICLKMMAKSTDDRYSRAAEVAAALRQFLEETATAAKSSQHVAAVQARDLAAHKQQIVRLLQGGEFGPAIDELEEMAHRKSEAASQHAAWAAQELARVRSLPADLLEKGPGIVPAAVELIASQEYAEGARLLRAIPEPYRSSQAKSLLEKAAKLEDEATQLNARMQEAVRTRQYDGLQDDLRRLLELQPGNLVARELYEKLATYSPGQTYRFDGRGNLLPSQRVPILGLLTGIVRQALRNQAQRQKYADTKPGATPSRRKSRNVPVLPIALGLAAFALIVLTIVLLLRNGDQTVRIEIDETLLSDQTVALRIDGKEIEIRGVGQTIELKPGEHGYEILRGDEVIRARQFMVVKGEEVAIRIRVEEAPLPTVASAPEEPPADTSEPTEKSPSSAGSPSEGEVALFNGRDFEGWQPVPQASSGDWVIENGAIECASEHTPILWTDRTYGNFHLKLEYLLDANADGGIYLRSHSRQYGSYKGAMEVSLSGQELAEHTTRNGGIYLVVAPTGNAFRPGEWNAIEIRAESSELTVILNGEEVLRTDLADRLAENPEKEFLANAFGYIGLQCFSEGDIGGTVRYRNIQLRELNEQPDFDSEPLEVRRFEGVDAHTPRLAISPQGRLMASSPQNLGEKGDRLERAIRLWDVETGHQRRQLDGQEGRVVCLGFTADSRAVLCVLMGKVLRWDVGSGKVTSFDLPETNLSAAISHDGKAIAGFGRGATPWLVNAATGKEIHRFGEQMRAVPDIAFVPGSYRFLTADARKGGAVRLWDPDRDTVMELPQDHEDGVFGVAVSPDGAKALSGGGQIRGGTGDAAIRYWDLRTRKLIRTLDGHTAAVMRVFFAPNGRYALSNQRGPIRTTILWDLDSGEEVCRMSGSIRMAPFTSDGQHVLLSHGDGIVRLWRLPLPAMSPEGRMSGPRASEDRPWWIDPSVVRDRSKSSADGDRSSVTAPEPKPPSGHLSREELEKAPDGGTPLHRRIEEVFWSGSSFQPDYQGVMAVEEDVLGPIKEFAPVGLAFHPDGRIVVSEEKVGSVEGMEAKFWDNGTLGGAASGLFRGRLPEEPPLERVEAKGPTWPLSGALTFDRSGIVHFSLTVTGTANGVCKTSKTAPFFLQLYTAPAASTLQIPAFDHRHLYFTAPDGVYRYPVTPPRAAAGGVWRPEGWLGVTGKGIGIFHTLVLSADRAIVELVVARENGGGSDDYYLRTLLLDRTTSAFHVLPWENASPMAVSRDRKRMIRYNSMSMTINEFRLADATQSSP